MPEGPSLLAGSLNMTMRLCSLLSQCNNFWPQKTWLWSTHTTYSPDLAPCDIFLFLRMKSKLEGCRFQESLKFRNNCWSSYKWFQNSVPVVLPAVAEMLDMLHKFGSGLLWRWQQKPTTKVSIYFLIESVWKLFDRPSHVSNKNFAWY
jgi:hypothetical protein